MTDPVHLVLDQTSSMIDDVGAPENAAWVFARCWLAVTRFRHLAGDVSDLDRAFADFRSLPTDFPGRPKLAATLAAACFTRGGLFTDRARMAAVREIAEVAGTDPEPMPTWPVVHAAVRSAALLSAAVHREPGFHLGTAVEQAVELAAIAAGHEPYATVAETTVAVLRQQRAGEENDVHNARRAADSLNDVADRIAGWGATSEADVLKCVGEFQSAMVRMDIPRVAELWPRLVALSRDPDQHDRESLARLVQTLTPLMAQVLAGHDTPTGPVADAEPAPPWTDRLPGESVDDWANRTAINARELLKQQTPDAVDQAVEMLTEVLAKADPHDARRPFHLVMLGVTLVHRSDRDRNDLRRGIACLEEARAAAGSVTSIHWRTTAEALTHAYRLNGQVELAREVAISGLRGQAWNALVQPDPDTVHAAARTAASRSLEVARLCLDDKDVDKAVAALEFGRGLILFSALESRDLEQRLVDAGEPELARRWRASAADQPEDLRREVMSALTGISLKPDASPGTRGDGPTRLIDPPELPEIRAALGALDADALVYLLPGDDKPGAAVVVHADDEADGYIVPGLKADWLSRFDGFLADSARGMRDAEIVGPATSRLDEVCEWAWEVAIGPLLEVLPEHARRIVLIPMRELARVPWHAARNPGTGEHAVEHVTFSYAASARLLCETAWRGRIPPDGGALVVADPDTAGAQRDLAAARAEAAAIARLYPDAGHVGRLPDGSPAPAGRGTKADLLAWLKEPEPGALLHLACHGVVRSGADESSYLVLADGERFPAEELVATPGRDISLAVLAACGSAESGRGYDEAFSIGSAFLATNARTVVSTQWSVPDAPTSVLMYMFHHYLREDGMAPVDALRAAQLWALRDRTPPASMPEPLRDYLARHDVAETAAWAGFVHSGQ